MSAARRCVLFALGGDAQPMLFALPASDVRQVFAPEHLARVPAVPAELRLSLCNAEGRLTTVVDPAPLCQLPPQAPGRTPRALLLDLERACGNHLAFWVSSIVGVFPVAAWSPVVGRKPAMVDQLYKVAPPNVPQHERSVGLLSLGQLLAALNARFEGMAPLAAVGDSL